MPNLLFIILAQIAQLEIDPPQLTINQSRQPFTWALSTRFGAEVGFPNKQSGRRHIWHQKRSLRRAERVGRGPVRVKSVAFFNRRLPFNFRYAPLPTKLARRCNMSRWANHGNLAEAQSITSSAVASIDSGKLRPSAFAVFRLTTSSYLVGA
jgi:hypothetical protein